MDGGTADSMASDGPEGRHVLVVDDDEFDRAIAAQILGEIGGLRATTASGGLEALAGLAAQAVDLVLMDVWMPGLDGCEATRRCRADPRFAQLPIVAVTAHATPEEQAMCRAVGMNEVLTKPLSVFALRSVVGRFLVPGGSSSAPCDEGGDEGGDEALPAGETFSPELGLKRCLGKPALYRKIAQRFLDSPPDLTLELMRAWQTGQRHDAALMAHNLISTAATLGATALAESARALQAAARLGDEVRWRASLAGVRREQARARAALRAHLGG